MENANEVEPVFDFGLFRTQFVLALKRTNGACRNFIEDIDCSEDLNEMVKVFRKNNEPIAEWLGFDTDPECDNCARAEGYAQQLSNELSQYKDIQSSVADEYKLKAFIEHRNNYNIEELECLFNNGKTLLEMLNKTER